MLILISYSIVIDLKKEKQINVCYNVVTVYSLLSVYCYCYNYYYYILLLYTILYIHICIHTHTHTHTHTGC